MVEREGGPLPKVIDFGIAKATGQVFEPISKLTSLNQFMGTPAYMSLEQVEFGMRDVDTALPRLSTRAANGCPDAGSTATKPPNTLGGTLKTKAPIGEPFASTCS